MELRGRRDVGGYCEGATAISTTTEGSDLLGLAIAVSSLDVARQGKCNKIDFCISQTKTMRKKDLIGIWMVSSLCSFFHQKQSFYAWGCGFLSAALFRLHFLVIISHQQQTIGPKTYQ